MMRIHVTEIETYVNISVTAYRPSPPRERVLQASVGERSG